MRTRYFSLVLALLLCQHAGAQSIERRNDSLFAIVKQYFNDKNTAALYSLTSDAFRSRFNKDAFEQASKTIYNFGTIERSEFKEFKSGVSIYLLTCTSAKVQMYIGSNEQGKLDVYGVRPHKEAEKTTTVLSSNPLKTLEDRRLDTIASNYMKAANTVGLSIGIWKDGRTTTYGYGETAKGNNKLPDENSIFEIGSVTKTFTATLLAYYADKGKLKLSDPITKYLPDSVASNKELGAITLLMLSNHTSGLPSIPDNFMAHITDARDPYKDYKRTHMFSYLKSCKPASEPGSTYGYSNLAAGLLGDILEQVSGKSYEKMVHDVICSPLKMKSTVIRLGDMSDRFVKVYNSKGDETPPWDMGVLPGAGALRSSVYDLLLYARANLEPGSDVLGKAIRSTHEVTFNKSEKVGLGWHITTVKGTPVIWHNGGTYGSSSFVAFVPGRNIAVVTLSNAAESVDDLAVMIVDMLL